MEREGWGVSPEKSKDVKYPKSISENIYSLSGDARRRKLGEYYTKQVDANEISNQLNRTENVSAFRSSEMSKLFGEKYRLGEEFEENEKLIGVGDIYGEKVVTVPNRNLGEKSLLMTITGKPRSTKGKRGEIEGPKAAAFNTGLDVKILQNYGKSTEREYAVAVGEEAFQEVGTDKDQNISARVKIKEFRSIDKDGKIDIQILVRKFTPDGKVRSVSEYKGKQDNENSNPVLKKTKTIGYGYNEKTGAIQVHVVDGKIIDATGPVNFEIEANKYDSNSPKNVEF